MHVFIYTIIQIMGFEQVIPPIPDRQAQLEGINRLEQSWLNQPYYKYYMNESLRQPKIAYSERLNNSYKLFWRNFALSCFGLIPISLLCKRFFITRGGLPITYKPDYFERIRTDSYFRQSKYLKFIIPVHLVASVLVGAALTDWEVVFCDMKYEFLHKTPVMM